MVRLSRCGSRSAKPPQLFRETSFLFNSSRGHGGRSCLSLYNYGTREHCRPHQRLSARCKNCASGPSLAITHRGLLNRPARTRRLARSAIHDWGVVGRHPSMRRSARATHRCQALATRETRPLREMGGAASRRTQHHAWRRWPDGACFYCNRYQIRAKRQQASLYRARLRLQHTDLRLRVWHPIGE